MDAWFGDGKYYRTLGVKPGIDKAGLKKAYRALVLK